MTGDARISYKREERAKTGRRAQKKTHQGRRYIFRHGSTGGGLCGKRHLFPEGSVTWGGGGQDPKADD